MSLPQVRLPSHFCLQQPQPFYLRVATDMFEREWSFTHSNQVQDPTLETAQLLQAIPVVNAVIVAVSDYSPTEHHFHRLFGFSKSEFSLFWYETLLKGIKNGRIPEELVSAYSSLLQDEDNIKLSALGTTDFWRKHELPLEDKSFAFLPLGSNVDLFFFHM